MHRRIVLHILIVFGYRLCIDAAAPHPPDRVMARPEPRTSKLLRLTIPMLILIGLLSMNSAAAWSPPNRLERPEADDPIAWLEADEAERETVLRMLHSDDWPFRVFGLLRLERYTGHEVIALLGKRLHDDVWQVRCFAIQQAMAMNIPLTASDFSRERDPRVLRAALRQGIAIPEFVVKPIGERLLRGSTLDEVLLGIELAAASSIESLREQARAVTGRLIMNMNNAIAAYATRRLTRVLGLPPTKRSVSDWKQWLNSVRGNIEFKQRAADRSPMDGVSVFARVPILVEMDNASFARLVDYLAVLSQSDLDLVIVMDITQSMAPMLAEAHAGVDLLLQFMNDITRELRLGFVAYRDHDNPPIWQGHPFTTDVGSIRDFLFNLSTQGGADLPEAVYEGLAACRNMEWRRTATRQIILVGDAPPHERDYERLEQLTNDYAKLELTVHAVHVPMQRNPQHYQRMTPQQRAEDEAFLGRYNAYTARTYRDIARHGMGKFTTLDEAEDLVPSIMHFTIDQEWRNVFDAFYDMYVDLCR